MPSPSRKRTRATYFQRHNHRQKGVERRWKDKYLELEKRYGDVLDTCGSFIIMFIIFIIIYISINKLINALF